MVMGNSGDTAPPCRAKVMARREFGRVTIATAASPTVPHPTEPTSRNGAARTALFAAARGLDFPWLASLPRTAHVRYDRSITYNPLHVQKKKLK